MRTKFSQTPSGLPDQVYPRLTVYARDGVMHATLIKSGTQWEAIEDLLVERFSRLDN
jgi:hypothetical protein